MHHTCFEGNHYDMGLRWGAALAEKGFFLMERAPFPVTTQRRRCARESLPFYERYFPEILEELRALARGQGCPEEELEGLVLSMYAIGPACACSCFAVSAGGRVLLGRNSDFWAALEEENRNVIYRFSGENYDFSGNTTAFVEMEDGVNREGLAVGLTAVCPTGLRPGFNAGMLVRYCLEKCGTVEQALEAICMLPRGSAQTITLADRSGAVAVAECCPEKVEILRGTEDRPFVWAVNGFFAPGMAPFRVEGVDDWQAERRGKTLEKALTGCKGRLRTAQAQRLLAGEYGFLCQYDRSEGKDTVWSVVYDLSQGMVYRAEGNPGRTPFQRDERFAFFGKEG